MKTSNDPAMIQTYLDQAVAALQVLPKTGYRETLEGIPHAVAEHVGELGA